MVVVKPNIWNVSMLDGRNVFGVNNILFQLDYFISMLKLYQYWSTSPVTSMLAKKIIEATPRKY